jgi:sugar-specific transcriptional regulator TrmB
MTTTVEALEPLGFTETEALVYCELVRSGVASGYGLAKAVGKARANVYQALANLMQRGAVQSEDGEVQIFRATPPAELIAALERAFHQQAAAAQAALAMLEKPEADDRIYHLKTVDQAIERAAAMIRRARQIVLVDAFEAPLRAVGDELERAAARGVMVAGLTYGPTPWTGLDLVTSAASDFLLARWPGLQLTVVTDASEYMLALLSSDMTAIKHGVWSDSRFLASMQHSGLSAEIRLASLKTTGRPMDHIALLEAYPPGLAQLVGPQHLESAS